MIINVSIWFRDSLSDGYLIIVHRPELDHSGPIQSDRPLTNGGRIIRSGRLRWLHSFSAEFFNEKTSSMGSTEAAEKLIDADLICILWPALNRISPPQKSGVKCPL